MAEEREYLKQVSMFEWLVNTWQERGMVELL